MTLKHIVIADVHIDAYRAHSEIRNGIPSRLHDYIVLAEAIATIAQEHRVGVIHIAGDLANTSINSAMVGNTIRQFLEILGTSVPTVAMIHGNHDWDGLDFRDEHKDIKSVIGIFDTVEDGVEYLDNQSAQYQGDATRFHYLGWRGNQKVDWDSIDADVLIGHALIKASRGTDGHIFKSGYDAEFLSKKFKWAFMGDVHVHQRLGNVVIPGTPIPRSFQDQPHGGLILVDDWNLPPKYISLDHVPCHRFIKDSESNRDNYEHLFPGSTLHFQEAKRKVAVAVSDTAMEGVTDNTSSESAKLERHLRQIIRTNKSIQSDENVLVNEAMRILTAKVAWPGVANAQTWRLTHLAISQFKRIAYTEIDFSAHVSPILLSGENDQGKSTILEALRFCLTGSCSVDKSKVQKHRYVRQGAQPENMEVGATFQNGKDQKLVVRRSLDKVSVFLDGEPQTNAKDVLSDYFGLTAQQYDDAIYMNQRRREFLLDMTPMEQLSLMTALGCSIDIDAIRDKYRAEAKGKQESINGMQSKLDVIRKEIDSYDKIENGSPFQDADRFLLSLEDEDLEQKIGLDAFGASLAEFTLAATALNYRRWQARMRSLRERIQKADHETIVNQRCSLCGTELTGDLLAAALQRSQEAESSSRGASYELKSIENDWPEDTESRMAQCSQLAARIRGHRRLENFKRDRREALREDQNRFNSNAVVLHRELQFVKDITVLFSPSGIQPYLVQDTISWINENLESMCRNVGLKIVMEPFSYTATGAIKAGLSIAVEDDLGKYSYFECGGARDKFCDLALIVCINNMMICKCGLSLLILDEIHQFFDANMVDKSLAVIMASNAETMIVVSHDEKLKKHFDSRITMVNGVAA
jgi:DNA repair exonuclease SbcCD nuclease subunit/energy-coupling factor transporter ATP-binding protein EcfA2